MVRLAKELRLQAKEILFTECSYNQVLFWQFSFKLVVSEVKPPKVNGFDPA